MSFKTLIGELEAMQKSLGAAEGGNGAGVTGAAGEGAGAGTGTGATGATGEGAGSELLGKSMTVLDGDGNPIQAVDGTELVKSLMARVQAMETVMDSADSDVLKAMQMMKSTIAAQADLLKSMQDHLAAVGDTGRGRKSVLNVHEKPAGQMTKSQPDGLSPTEFMAKAVEAQGQGKLLAREVAVAELSLQTGVPVPENIVRKVIGASA